MSSFFGKIIDTKLRYLIPALVITTSLMISLGIGGISYYKIVQSEYDSAMKHLESVVQGRASNLNNYLKDIHRDLVHISNNPTTIDAVQEFSQAWHQIPGDKKSYLQGNYIDGNPNPIGQKEKLDFANDGSYYSTLHKEYHPWFREFLEEQGYYDIFLFDMDGNLIYTVFKELDYATNLNTGEYNDTDLGKAYRAALDLEKHGDFSFYDFQPYAPSNGAPASFVSTPVFDNTGQKIGVLVFQMPIDRLNSVINEKIGLGDTGRMFVVGEDRLFRNDLRFAEESTILKKKLDYDFVDAAFNGGLASSEIDQGISGNPIFSVYQPIAFDGVKWLIGLEVDRTEALSSTEALVHSLIMIAVPLLIVILCIGLLISSGISKKINTTIQVMRKIAEGELDTEIPSANPNSEIGHITKCLEFFKTQLVRINELNEARVVEAKKKEQQLKQEMLAISDSLEQELHRTIEQVNKSANDMQNAANTMTEAGNNVSEKSAAVADATSDATSHVASVAAATEELSASTNEISSQVAQASVIVNTAVETASMANAKIQDLQESSNKISTIINLISDIAERTNLLALNATIEAARAGEAGKGFSVVAAEVKNLATQTGQATDDITKQIAEIQKETLNSVESIQTIMQTIQEIDSVSSSISSAVEEQGIATGEISNSTNQASNGTAEVAREIKEVNQECDNVKEIATDVSSMTNDMRAQILKLQNELTKVLRESYAGNRRQSTRYKPQITVGLTCNGQSFQSDLANVSAGGIAFKDQKLLQKATLGSTVTVTYPGFNQSLNGVIEGTENGVVRIIFSCGQSIRDDFGQYLEKKYGTGTVEKTA